MFCSSGGPRQLVIWQFPVVDPTEASLLGSPLGSGTGMDRILMKRFHRARENAGSPVSSGFSGRPPYPQNGARQPKTFEHLEVVARC